MGMESGFGKPNIETKENPEEIAFPHGEEAVRLFEEQDLTLAEVSRNLDIDPKSLKSWVALYDAGALKGSLGVTKLSSDQLRIRELERELAIAREERDILRKATAYFAKLSK